MEIDTEQLNNVLSTVRGRLLGMRADAGNWQGHLSSSALATATAVGALSLVDADGNKDLLEGGLKWLCENVNDDGGWGDTPVCSASGRRAPCQGIQHIRFHPPGTLQQQSY